MKRLLKFLRRALLSFAGAALMLVIPAAGAAEVDAGSGLPSYEDDGRLRDHGKDPPLGSREAFSVGHDGRARRRGDGGGGRKTGAFSCGYSGCRQSVRTPFRGFLREFRSAQGSIRSQS